MSSHFNRIWLPGFMLQSVVTGGGYATGRELVEFFLSAGPVGGLLGMLVATALFSVVSILCFELARLTQSFNYRNFFDVLLGRGWFLYEIAYVVLGILVLAVIAAATSEMLATHLNLDRTVGTVLLGKKIEAGHQLAFPLHAGGAQAAGTYGSSGPYKLPGTVVLVTIFFASFVLYYFVNWKYLSELWLFR